MTFATYHETTTTAWTSHGSVNEKTINYPTTVNADDLLLAFYVADGSVALSSNDGGFTISNTGRLGVMKKKAVGTEDGGTFEIVMASPEQGIVYIRRYSGWSGDIADIEVQMGTEGAGTSLDPPSLTATAGAGDNVFVAAAGWSDDQEAITAWPSGYGNLVEQHNGASANNGASLASGDVQSTSATENPGAFTIAGSESYHACTVVIPPAADGATPSRLLLLGVG